MQTTTSHNAKTNFISLILTPTTNLNLTPTPNAANSHTPSPIASSVRKQTDATHLVILKNFTDFKLKDLDRNSAIFCKLANNLNLNPSKNPNLLLGMNI